MDERRTAPSSIVPPLLAVDARRVGALLGAALLTLWLPFVAWDVAGGGDARPAHWELAAGFGLFEWVQWLVLAVAITSAAYAAGHCERSIEPLLLRLTVGLSLHLVGSVGLIRNSVVHGLGSARDGAAQLTVDVVLVLITHVPLAVVLLQLRAVADAPLRRLITLALGFVSIAGVGSVTRSVDGLFVRVGESLDRWLLAGRLGSGPPDPEAAHHHLLETMVGDTVALVSAVLVLLVVTSGFLSEGAREPGGYGSAEWPALLRLPAGRLTRLVGVGVAGVLLMAYLVDIQGAGGELTGPAYLRLFNDGPLEWLNWSLVALTAAAAGYASARLASVRPVASNYFLWLSAGMSLVLIDELSHLRHAVTAALAPLGEDPLGVSRYSLVTVLIFGSVGAVPAYGLVRYGRGIWGNVSARRCALAGYGLYGSVAVASALEGFVDGYERIGGAVDRVLLGGRLPAPPGESVAAGHFLLTDGAIDESVEVFAAAFLLAVVLTYVASVASASDTEAPRRSPASAGAPPSPTPWSPDPR